MTGAPRGRMPADWKGTNDELYALVSYWPDWVVLESTYGGGRFLHESLLTEIDGVQYAVAQTVSNEPGGRTGLEPESRIYRLTSLRDEDDEGWTWNRLATIDMPDLCADSNASREGRQLLARLPDLVRAHQGS